MSADTESEVEPLEGHRETRATPWVRSFFGLFGIVSDEGSNQDSDAE